MLRGEKTRYRRGVGCFAPAEDDSRSIFEEREERIFSDASQDRKKEYHAGAGKAK
jgi:hypothetical protein